MAITVNGKIYRNLQEQVKYLTDRTNEIKPYVAGTGITISGQTIAIDPSVYDEIAALRSDITDLQTALIGVSDLIGGDT